MTMLEDGPLPAQQPQILPGSSQSTSADGSFRRVWLLPCNLPRVQLHLTPNSYQQAKQQCNRSRNGRCQQVREKAFFLLGPCKRETCDLRPHIEPYLNQMAKAPINVEAAAISQVELA